MIKFIKGGLSGFDPKIDHWDEPNIRLYKGNLVKGRPTRAFGNKNFNYAGKVYKPDPWTKPMKYIKDNLQTLIKEELNKEVEFNFCLCGFYSEEGKGIPYHSDTVPTEKDLVVSVSFGAPRVFGWRQYAKNIKDKTNTSEIDVRYKQLDCTKYFLLEDGDVIIFDGKSQLKSTHNILDVEAPIDTRVNLTFRTGI